MAATRTARIATSSMVAATAVALLSGRPMPAAKTDGFPRLFQNPPASPAARSPLQPQTPPQIQAWARRSDLADRLRDRFRPGDQYVWLYRDGAGRPTSWEKYTVRDPDGDGAVVIEMSTKFREEDEYATHHRMRVDMSEQLLARRHRGDWRIGFERLDADGGWRRFGVGENVQAFEEKFDVFAMEDDEGVRAGATRVVGADGSELALRRSPRHDYTGSWYAPSGHPLSGVAVLKDFAEHSFTLIRSKRGDDEVEVKIDAGTV